MSLLDVGTGLTAVLAIFARRELRCGRVCGVDHVGSVAASARRAAEYVCAAIDIREGSLFDAVDGRFDVIVFNAPYIDDFSGARLGLLDSDLHRRRYAGGRDGLQTVNRFLSQAAQFLAPGGRVLLGVNHFYVAPSAVEEVVARYGWRVERVCRNRLTRAAVHALAR